MGRTVIKKVLCCHQQPIYSYPGAAALLWSGTETVGSFNSPWSPVGLLASVCSSLRWETPG